MNESKKSETIDSPTQKNENLINSEEQINKSQQIEIDLIEINKILNSTELDTEELEKYTSKIYLLINEREVYEKPGYWWDKQISLIFDQLIDIHLNQHKNFQKVIEIIKNISKKFKEVCGTKLVDVLFEILNKNKDDLDKMQLEQINRQALAECIDEEMLKKYSNEFSTILKEIGEDACFQNALEDSSHRFVASWYIHQNFCKKEKKEMECLINNPLRKMVDDSIFASSNRMNNEKNNNFDKIEFFKNFKLSIQSTSEMGALRKSMTNRAYWNAIFFNELQLNNYSLHLFELLKGGEEYLSLNLKSELQKSLEKLSKGSSLQSNFELPSSISFYRNYLHSIRVTMYFLMNNFCEPLLLSNTKTDQLYNLDSIKNVDTSGIVLDLLEILCEMQIAQGWIGNSFIKEFVIEDCQRNVDQNEFFDILNYESHVASNQESKKVPQKVEDDDEGFEELIQKQKKQPISKTEFDNLKKTINNSFVTSNNASFLRGNQPSEFQRKIATSIENFRESMDKELVEEKIESKDNSDTLTDDPEDTNNEKNEKKGDQTLITFEDFQDLPKFLDSFVKNLQPFEKNFRLAQIIPSKLINMLLERMINECISVLGIPPCFWCLVSIGSLSRLEICPFSDLECVMLIETRSDLTEKYFYELCRMIELRGKD